MLSGLMKTNMNKWRSWLYPPNAIVLGVQCFKISCM